MLDLKSGVHFQEKEVARRIVDEKLDGTGGIVVDGLRNPQRRFAQSCASSIGKTRRGRLLDELLMMALNRALAIEQMCSSTMAVAEHLNFDMARSFEIALEDQRRVAESGRRLASRRRQRRREIAVPLHETDPLAAAASARFDQQGIADATGLVRERSVVLRRSVIPRDRRHAEAMRQCAGAFLRTHLANRSCPRADEGQAGGCAGLGESGIFG